MSPDEKASKGSQGPLNVNWEAPGLCHLFPLKANAHKVAIYRIYFPANLLLMPPFDMSSLITELKMVLSGPLWSTSRFVQTRKGCLCPLWVGTVSLITWNKSISLLVLWFWMNTQLIKLSTDFALVPAFCYCSTSCCAPRCSSSCQHLPSVSRVR